MRSSVCRFSQSSATHGAAPHLGAGGVRQGYVHIDDLAEFYVQALERAPAGTMLHAVTDEIVLGAC
jgi:nucleoside-diphosphate-sugar epimerase